MKRQHMKPFFMDYDAKKFPKNMEPSPRMREIAQVQVLRNSNIPLCYILPGRKREREEKRERARKRKSVCERERESRERKREKVRERNRENMCETGC